LGKRLGGRRDRDWDLEGEGHEVWRGIGLHLLDLLQDPLHCRVAPVELARGRHRLRRRGPPSLAAAAADRRRISAFELGIGEGREDWEELEARVGEDLLERVDVSLSRGTGE
jgi:hypothetical protein